MKALSAADNGSTATGSTATTCAGCRICALSTAKQAIKPAHRHRMRPMLNKSPLLKPAPTPDSIAVRRYEAPVNGRRMLLAMLRLYGIGKRDVHDFAGDGAVLR